MKIKLNSDTTKPSLERRLEIVNLVGLRGKLHVDELSTIFHVTGATIRADLRFLEKNGFLIRAHGYALVNKAVLSQLSDSKKKVQQTVDSRLAFFGETVTALLQENDSIFIDSNKLIRQSMRGVKDWCHSKVVSNDLNLVRTLHVENIHLFMTGGRVNLDLMKFTGSQMIKNVKSHRFSKSFIFIDGFSSSQGVFANSESDAELIKTLREISEQIIVIATSECFENHSQFWVFDTSSIDAVITDENVSIEVLDNLKSNNVTIFKPT